MYTYIHIIKCMINHMYVYTYVYKYVCTITYAYMNRCIYKFIFMYIHILYICIHIYINIYVHICRILNMYVIKYFDTYRHIDSNIYIRIYLQQFVCLCPSGTSNYFNHDPSWQLSLISEHKFVTLRIVKWFCFQC